jgi:cytidylate kinase
MLIAVDGTAASGKGTLAHRLAKALNLRHLDTGSLYRGVGLSLLRAGVTPDNVDIQRAENAAINLDLSLTKDPEIRSNDVSNMAAIVAAMEKVREALKKNQRHFTEVIPPEFNGAVLDGRDIGTVILPDADHKFFVDANPKIRAERRLKELLENGIATDFETVFSTLTQRDERDRSRPIAPLKQAKDAIFVDTGEKTVDEMVAFALSSIE